MSNLRRRLIATMGLTSFLLVLSSLGRLVSLAIGHPNAALSVLVAILLPVTIALVLLVAYGEVCDARRARRLAAAGAMHQHHGRPCYGKFCAPDQERQDRAW